MTEPRRMTIYFTDGTSLIVKFPKQEVDEQTYQATIERVLEQQMLIMESEGAAYMFPYNNIKYIKVHPVDAPYPEGTLKGVEVVA